MAQNDILNAINMMDTVISAYKEAYHKNGINTPKAEELMDQVFRDTWNILKDKYIANQKLAIFQQFLGGKL